MITFSVTLRLILLTSIACAISVCKCTTKLPDPMRLAFVDNPVESGLPSHWLPINLIKRIMESRVLTLEPKLNFIKASHKVPLMLKKLTSLSIKTKLKKEVDAIKIKATKGAIKMIATTKSKMEEILPKIQVKTYSTVASKNNFLMKLMGKIQIITEVPSVSTQFAKDLVTKLSSTKGVNTDESIADDNFTTSAKSYHAVQLVLDVPDFNGEKTPITSSSTLSTYMETILKATALSTTISSESTIGKSSSMAEYLTSANTVETTPSTKEVTISISGATTSTAESTTSKTGPIISKKESTVSTSEPTTKMTEPTTSTIESSTSTSGLTTNTTDYTTSSTEPIISASESATSTTELTTTSTTESTTYTTESTTGTTESITSAAESTTFATESTNSTTETTMYATESNTRFFSTTTKSRTSTPELTTSAIESTMSTTASSSNTTSTMESITISATVFTNSTTTETSDNNSYGNPFY